MKALRMLLALAVLLAAIVPSALLFEPARVMWGWRLWGALFLAAIFAAALFLVTRRIWPGKLRSLAVGALLAYAVWIGLLVAGDPPNDLQWFLAVTIFFIIPFSAPILVGAWFSSGIFLAAFAKPNNALQQTSENERG